MTCFLPKQTYENTHNLSLSVTLSVLWQWKVSLSTHLESMAKKEEATNIGLVSFSQWLKVSRHTKMAVCSLKLKQNLLHHCGAFAVGIHKQFDRVLGNRKITTKLDIYEWPALTLLRALPALVAGVSIFFLFIILYEIRPKAGNLQQNTRSLTT